MLGYPFGSTERGFLSLKSRLSVPGRLRGWCVLLYSAPPVPTTQRHGNQGPGLREMKGWAHGEIGELIDIIIDLAWVDIRLRPYIIVWVPLCLDREMGRPADGLGDCSTGGKEGIDYGGGVDFLRPECRSLGGIGQTNLNSQKVVGNEEAGRRCA